MRLKSFRSIAPVLGLAALAMSADVAVAANISFIENSDEITPVIVNTNLTNADGSPVVPVTTAETATVDGFHYPAISPNAIPAGTYSAGLSEGPGGPLSDLVVVTAGQQVQCGTIGICQELLVNFYSDTEGGPPLETLIAGQYGGALVEDGTLQDLTALLGTAPGGIEGLTVSVQSDLDAIPEPGSLALLGLGLCGLGLAVRRQKRESIHSAGADKGYDRPTL